MTTIKEQTTSSASALAFAQHRLKAVVRRLIPAHRRFVRAGEAFLRGGEREVHELPSLVAKGTTAVDVGAHIGDYTYSLCRTVGPSGRVIAIEPIPDLAAMLSRATRRLDLPVTVHHCALSCGEGEGELLIPFENGERMAGLASLNPRAAAKGRTCRVRLRRLDDLCSNEPGSISFIKIDVEGHELDVLRGGESTLSRHRPNLLIEIEQRHSPRPIRETFEWLIQRGYVGEFLDPDRGQRRPLSEFDVVEHQERRRHLIDVRRYVSNFIFTCPGREGRDSI